MPSLFEKIRLFQEWAPILGYLQNFTAAKNEHEQALAVTDCAEWLASKTQTTLDDELVKHVAAVLKTEEGKALVMWVAEKVKQK